ncbi:MAG: FKBP-type peptidyl-prolyl cis-trans isomerase [Bacteroidales bacterium]|nr:FKBP-type peptidyl-prolyl cis-trans isomerase [Bacteroidales bacterium]
MKNSAFIAVLIIFLANSVFSQEQVRLKNRKDSVSYAVGVSMYDGTTQFGITLDHEMVLKGYMSAADSAAYMRVREANDYIGRVVSQVKNELVERNKKMGKLFLEKNSEVEGIIETESGLQYKILKQGTGEIPTADSKVKVNYKGFLLDGTVFDSSEDRGETGVFTVSSIIPAWTEVLQLMPVGSRYLIFSPSELAYGDRYAGDVEPGSTIMFEIELLEIMKQ